MKFIGYRVMIAVVIVTLAGVVTFGKTKEVTVTLNSDTNLGGTVISKGTYTVVYDDQTSELSIVKGKELIAKTKVRVEIRERKAGAFELRTSTNEAGVELEGIAFSGSRENLIVEHNGMQTGGN